MKSDEVSKGEEEAAKGEEDATTRGEVLEVEGGLYTHTNRVRIFLTFTTRASTTEFE